MSPGPRIGFIGFGLIGSSIALRLLDQGWDITVWNREPRRLEPVVAAGATAGASPRAVAEASKIILLRVLDTNAVLACMFGPDGVAEAGGGASLLMDHSRIDPAAMRPFAARLKAATGAGWIDAAVSGGPALARTGALTIMAGADPADWDRGHRYARHAANGNGTEDSAAIIRLYEANA